MEDLHEHFGLAIKNARLDCGLTPGGTGGTGRDQLPEDSEQTHLGRDALPFCPFRHGLQHLPGAAGIYPVRQKRNVVMVAAGSH